MQGLSPPMWTTMCCAALECWQRWTKQPWRAQYLGRSQRRLARRTPAALETDVTLWQRQDPVHITPGNRLLCNLFVLNTHVCAR